MSHITPADVRCISHVGYEENIDSGTFLTPWREKKTRRRLAKEVDMCMRSTEWRWCNDKINLRAWLRQIWILMFHLVTRVANCARQILTRLTKWTLLSMLERVLFIVFIRFHLFMRRFRREFASTIKHKKKRRNIHNAAMRNGTRDFNR